MCKPSVTQLPVHSDGPCSFSIRSFSSACSALSLGYSWRNSLANVLRRWADKAEGVRSLVITGYGPANMTYQDVVDAATVGFNGANKYMNDLWRDRTYGSVDTSVKAVTPAKIVG